MHKFLFLLLMCSSLLTLSSCEKEPGNEELSNQLLGTWNLKSAQRNGQSTETLNNFKLEFENDTLLFSNLSGSREQQTYSVDNSIIQTEGARMNPEYQILQISDSTLTLKMYFNDFEFDFEFVK